MNDADRLRLAGTFDAAAGLYDRARPGFASAALDWLLEGFGPRSCVLDLGAGTGKLTAALLQRGLNAVAADPSAGMLAVLHRKAPLVPVVRSRAEAVGLASGRFDAVLCGSAFHWFDRPAADGEIARLLRPGGVVGLLWNRRDPSSPFMAGFDDARTSSGQPAPEDNASTILTRVFFGPTEHREFPHQQRLTPSGIADLVASRSYVIAMPADERGALLERVRRSAAELSDGGEFDLPYRTIALRARRR